MRAYHHFERSHDGDAFTWKDVSEAIDEYTGVRIPPERLRQFVEGVRKPEGGYKHPVPKADRVKAIYEFTTHEELRLLTEAELEEFKPASQALLRLMEYLEQSFDSGRITPPESVKGDFRMWRSDDTEFVASELTLEKPLENGLIEVHQSDDFYDRDVAEDFQLLSSPDRHRARISQVQFSGWALLTPEDNFFFFLKNDRNARNRYYFTLASDLSHGSAEALTQLFVLDHDYPLETRFKSRLPDEISEEVIEQTREKLAVYSKVFAGQEA